MSEFQSAEQVIKGLHDARERVKALEAINATQHEKVTAIERTAEDIRLGLQRVNQEHAAANRYQASGTDDEVVRSYVIRGDKPAGVDRRDVAMIADGERLGYGGKSGAPDARWAGHKDVGVVRMLGGDDGVGGWEWGLLDDPEPRSVWQQRAQELADTRSMVRMIQRGKRSPISDRALLRHLQRGPDAIRRVFADNSTEGAEFIPDIVQPVLQRELEQMRRIEGMFAMVDLPTGGATKNPFLTAGAQPFLVGTPTAGDLDLADLVKSQPTTTEISAEPVSYSVTVPAFRDAVEDSIIEWSGFGRMLLAEALRDGFEDVIVNGDTNGGDTGLASWTARGRWAVLGHSSDHRKGQIGLRHRAIDNSCADDKSAAQAAADVMKYKLALAAAQMSGDLAHITSIEFVIAKLITDSNLLTVDKYGSFATLLTGEIARLGNVPIVVSDFMSAAMNNSGVYDHVTTDKTGLLTVNRSRFQVARRRGTLLEAETVARQHVTYLVASDRKVFRTVDRSTTKNVHYAYKLSTS
jgi:hypothetical protein